MTLRWRISGNSRPSDACLFVNGEIMAKMSAGLLMYRKSQGRVEVFLVHPGGPFWAKKDSGAWSIPKGEHQPDEEPLAAARREFREETGIELKGSLRRLKPIKQAGGKVVQAWAFEGDADPSTIRSNTFVMKWPPGSGHDKTFPEVDRAAWFEMDEAKTKILKGQVALLNELQAALENGL
jgi:predicted NUDIX family NTP pyrophosphohydrolase